MYLKKNHPRRILLLREVNDAEKLRILNNEYLSIHIIKKMHIVEHRASPYFKLS